MKFSQENHLFLHIHTRELDLLVTRNECNLMVALCKSLIQLRSPSIKNRALLGSMMEQPFIDTAVSRMSDSNLELSTFVVKKLEQGEAINEKLLEMIAEL